MAEEILETILIIPGFRTARKTEADVRRVMPTLRRRPMDRMLLRKKPGPKERQKIEIALYPMIQKGDYLASATLRGAGLCEEAAFKTFDFNWYFWAHVYNMSYFAALSNTTTIEFGVR
jgi:hypothetical protein